MVREILTYRLGIGVEVGFHHRVRIALAILALCLGMLAAGCVGTPLRRSPTVRFQDTDLILRDGRQTFSLKDVIASHASFAKCYSVQKRGLDYFVVYGTSEMSRGGSGDGNGLCGAGIESYIRWLHIREGKIIEQEDGLYESCWKDRDGGNIRWTGGKLVWEAEGYEPRADNTMDEITYIWRYDPKKPEAGIAELRKISE